MSEHILPRPPQQAHVPVLDPADVLNRLESGTALLVDVREVAEYARVRIPGALLLPLSEFDPDLVPRISGARLILFCAIGKRSEAAARILIGAGHRNVAHLGGGLEAWKAAGLELECTPEPRVRGQAA